MHQYYTAVFKTCTIYLFLKCNREKKGVSLSNWEEKSILESKAHLKRQISTALQN